MKVYNKALQFTRIARQTTRRSSKEEIFGLTAQFKRAGDSIALNIAEGAGSPSKKEFGRFLDYSIRSGFECIACSDIGKVVPPKVHYDKILSEVNEIIAMICSLQKSLAT